MQLRPTIQPDRPSPAALPAPGTPATVLERARGALERGDARGTLAALDQNWDAAMRTEGGWYYRAAALALLGLPGDAEGMLRQALIPRGGSVALLYLQSVVRSDMGDLQGARDSLASALARAPADPVLQGWHAVLSGPGNAYTPMSAAVHTGLKLLLAQSPRAQVSAAFNSAARTDTRAEPPAVPIPAAPEAPLVGRSNPDLRDASLADTFESGKRSRALALGCMALAFAAMVYGYGAAAIALAGGASWMALRSSTVAAAARRAAREDADH